MKRRLWGLGLGLAMLAGAVVAAAMPGLPLTASQPGASVRILAPADGAVLKSSEVTVKFAVKGMQVAPAGSMLPHSGHFHLYVDADAPAGDQIIPKDARHLHFGLGQTETTLHLAPGKHSLLLELGDGNHLPFKPRLLSSKVTIQVQ